MYSVYTVRNIFSLTVSSQNSFLKLLKLASSSLQCGCHKFVIKLDSFGTVCIPFCVLQSHGLIFFLTCIYYIYSVMYSFMCFDKCTESFILHSITIQNDSFTLEVPLCIPDLLNQNCHFDKIPRRFVCVLISYT